MSHAAAMKELSALSEPENLRHQLDLLYPLWNAFLKRSHPKLRDSHDDLMQQTAEDLLAYARQHPEAVLQDWRLFSFRILHRRIADHYRSPVRRWATTAVSDEVLPAGSNTDPERIAHYKSMLKRLVALMAELGENDRQLLMANVFTDADSHMVLSDAGRKRLSRLRALLRQKIES